MGSYIQSSLRFYEETVIYKFDDMRTVVFVVCVLIMAGILQSSADKGLWCKRFTKKCTALCGPSGQCSKDRRLHLEKLHHTLRQQQTWLLLLVPTRPKPPWV